MQARERAGELALLRSLGATRRQVFGLFLGEGAAMGLLGLVLGLVGGIGLAALLILVVNRAVVRLDHPAGLARLDLAAQAVPCWRPPSLAAAVPALRAGLSGADQLTRDDL